MKFNKYEYSLSLTSQFYFCSLPLRLDSYSRCTFNCHYCFANARGGNRSNQELKVANPYSLDNKLEKLGQNRHISVLDEFLINRQPLHFGGMSDPFLPAETKLKISLGMLKVLSKHNYPTVISTKSNLIVRDEYLEVLKQGTYVIQFSLSSLDDNLLKFVDSGTPGPTKLVQAIEILNREGIPTTIRIQPLLPNHVSDAFDIIQACSSLGVKHVAVEHLKLPIEKTWRGTKKLSQALNMDIPKHFADRKAQRIGREWVLPLEHRYNTILELRNYAHELGISFGAADNDLLLLSDGGCCCSGVDRFDGFKNYFKFNYAEASRIGLENNKITINAFDDIWFPKNSIGRYINSSSRIKSSNTSKTSLKEYIYKNWNGSTNGNSPSSFHGVIDSGLLDQNGYRIYKFTDSMRKLLKTKSSF